VECSIWKRGTGAFETIMKSFGFKAPISACPKSRCQLVTLILVFSFFALPTKKYGALLVRYVLATIDTAAPCNANHQDLTFTASDLVSALCDSYEVPILQHIHCVRSNRACILLFSHAASPTTGHFATFLADNSVNNIK
jgi:hypothetical protein